MALTNNTGSACGESGPMPMVRFQRTRIALLLVWMLLSGCASVEERQLRPGVFGIAAPANGFINSEERAAIVLRLRAQELCPKGFDRLSESRISDANGLETVV